MHQRAWRREEACSADGVIGRHRVGVHGVEAIAAGVVDGDNHDWFVVAVMKMGCSRLQADLETRSALKQAGVLAFLPTEKRLCVGSCFDRSAEKIRLGYVRILMGGRRNHTATPNPVMLATEGENNGQDGRLVELH
jgi:hypothetical protein